MFFFILITCLHEIVYILRGEIMWGSLTGFKGIKGKFYQRGSLVLSYTWVFIVVESSHKKQPDKSNQLASQNQDKLKTRLTDKVSLVSDDDTAQLS